MTIYSMTGFASVSREIQGSLLCLELRAVNHRYLDIQLRLPEELRTIELQLRELISSNVTRGKVECRATLTPSTSSAIPALELDHTFLNHLLTLAQDIARLSPTASTLTIGELIRWPGVLKSVCLASGPLQQCCLDMLSQLVSEFNLSRIREGEKLKVFLLERIRALEAIITAIRPKLPSILDTYMNKLANRLTEALGTFDDDRLKQEFTLFAQKIDVDEELSRLTTHLNEVVRILNTGGQMGKRLDFLMQELNREANTLGSKSVSSETTQASVELKVLIEQMREQIQNVE